MSLEGWRCTRGMLLKGVLLAFWAGAPTGCDELLGLPRSLGFPLKKAPSSSPGTACTKPSITGGTRSLKESGLCSISS